MVLTDDELKYIEEVLGRKPNELELGMMDVMFSEHCSYKSSRPILGTFPTEGENIILGPGDDAGLVSVTDKYALAVGMESHNHPSAIEPYGGAGTGIGGILRDIISMGARPIALVDCLNFGNPEKPEVFWQFKEAVSGMSDVAGKFNTPFISGNVSFYNETEGVTVNPSPIVGTVGVVENTKIKTMTLKDDGDVILVVGNTYPELDGSQYYKHIHNVVQGYPPKIRLEENYNVSTTIEKLIPKYNDNITSVHDISKGGLIIALALMSIKSKKGVNVNISNIPSTTELSQDDKLYSESNSRFIITVKEDALTTIEEALSKNNVAYSVIGSVCSDGFKISNDNDVLVDCSVEKITKENTTTIEKQMA